ncbi:MAG: sensor histidine kinase [Trueperaceae bacterium]|nr:sensor histidine kinase [Trueperaceae bacterium]
MTADAPVEPADRRTRELATLHRLGGEIARSPGERQVLERALACLIDMGGFSGGTAFRIVKGAPEPVATVRVPGSDDPPDPDVTSEVMGDATGRPGLDDGIRRAIASGDPVAQGARWTVPVERRAALSLIVGEGMGEGVGEGGRDDATAFLRTVATLVASGLRRAALQARLTEKERQRARLIGALLTAQEEERVRISRDLHDQIGQALTGLLLGLDAATEKPDPVELTRLKELTSATLGDVRRIALDLRPSVLDALGLEAAVRRFARELHERYGLETQVAVHLPRLSSVEETVLYRVCQEALTNVARHAQASSVSVVATAGERQIQLVVEDDGTGFDPSALSPADEVGIVGMRERLQLLGGSLSIETTPGRGTTVHARLPRRAG